MKIVNFFFLISLFFTFNSLSDETTSWELLKEGGKVVFIRHAYAPGGGDPNNFELYDCSTQRNLNEQGINQSKRMGKLFSEYSIPIDSVYSSQWCRCKQTADLLNMGSWQEFTGLNSFFQGHADRTDTLKKLQQKLDNLPADTLVLMITHQVTINAVTKISPASGGFVVYNTRTKVSKSVQLNTP